MAALDRGDVFYDVNTGVCTICFYRVGKTSLFLYYNVYEKQRVYHGVSSNAGTDVMRSFSDRTSALSWFYSVVRRLCSLDFDSTGGSLFGL